MCNPGWSGIGPYYTLGYKDCSIHLPSLQYICLTSAIISLCMTFISFIGLVLVRKTIKIQKLRTPDMILITAFLWNLFSMTIYFCFYCGYYIYSNYGMWILSCFWYTIILLQMNYMINFIIKISYKLQSDAEMAKVVAIVTAVTCIATYVIILLMVIFNEDETFHLLLIRLLVGAWTLCGTFYMISVLYYGTMIEKFLSGNQEHNQKQIHNLRGVKLSLCSVIFVFALILYPFFIIMPVIMQWIFPIAFSVVPIVFFWFLAH